MVRDGRHQARLDRIGRWLASGLIRLDGRGAQTSRARLPDPRYAAPAVAGKTGRTVRDQGAERRRPALPDDGLAPPASLARQRTGPHAAEKEIHHLAALQR